MQGLPRGSIHKESVQHELADIRHELRQGFHIVSFRMPPETFPSYQRDLDGLIDVSHFLQVKICMERFCVTNPSLRIPVRCIDGSAVEQGSNDHAGMLQTNPSAPVEDISVTISPPMPSAPVEVIPEDFHNNSILCEEVIIPSDMVVPTSFCSDNDVVPATAEVVTPSVDALLEVMHTSFRDLELVKILLERAEWRQVISTLSPSDFGRIVGSIKSEFDQPTAAESLALHCDGITCFHVVAVLETCVKWNRVNILERLIGHCVDLLENHQVLLSTLDEWDQMVANDVVARALEQETAPKDTHVD